MSLKKAIKKTVDYAAGFKSYINKEEIYQRLISKKYFSKKEVVEAIEILGLKKKKNKNFSNKMAIAMNIAEKIKKEFKDILFIGVSGSVASGHPKKNDDIDILVITKINKLWRTRLFLRLWVWKNKIPHRKYGEIQENNQFCFNLWLDESVLEIQRDKQNLRNAVDLILLKPLVNKNMIYEKFVVANSWAKKWVATPYENKISNFQFPISKKNIKNNKLEKISNYLYFWPQYGYMKRKIRGEKIGLHRAFFHRQMVK